FIPNLIYQTYKNHLVFIGGFSDKLLSFVSKSMILSFLLSA
ncbi:hypothetical protein A5815_002222, partial [Enterococcus faecium]